MVNGDGTTGHAGTGRPGSNGNQVFVGQFHDGCHFFRAAREYHDFGFLKEMRIPFFISLVLFQIFFVRFDVMVAHHFF